VATPLVAFVGADGDERLIVAGAGDAVEVEALLLFAAALGTTGVGFVIRIIIVFGETC
jgi:hypothetical protein